MPYSPEENLRATLSATLKRLSQTSQISLLLGSAILSICLLWWGSTLPHSLLSSSINAVATGLLVSASFGIMQSFFVEKLTRESLGQSVVNEMRSAIRLHHRRYFPTDEFEPSDRPNQAFNEQMTDDLHSSKEYWYNGLHAKFCAMRLLASRNRQVQAHFVLPDPRVPYALDARLRYRLAQQSVGARSPDELRQHMRRSLLSGLVGLFEARHSCDSIEILFIQEPALDRFELFDASVWVSLFSDMDRGTVFPRTVRFPRDSIIYRMQQSELSRIRRSPSTRRFEITVSTSRDDVVGLFEAMTGDTLDDVLFHELSEEFERSRARFLGSVGASALDGTRGSPR